MRTTRSAKATSLSLTKPAGAVTGDTLLATIDVRGGVPVTAPAGWASVDSRTVGTSLTKATFSHVVGASDPGPYAFTFPTSQASVGVVAAYSGVASVTLGGAVTSASSTTSLVVPTVTIANGGSVLVSLVGFASNGSITPPAAQTERAELSGGSGSTRIAGELSDSTRLAGPTGALTATTSKGAAGVQQVVILAA